MIDNKKICGILQETVFYFNKKFLIIGIGLNVIKSPTIANYPTTNLYEITGKKFTYKLIAKSLKLNFEKEFLKILKG